MVLAVKRNTLSVDEGKPCCWTGVIFVTAGIGQTQEKANWPILILRSKEPVPAKLTFMGPLGNLFMNINLFPGMLLVPLISISKGTDQQHSMPEEPAG